DKQDIWASSGSACTSRSSEPSHVLQAMGIARSALFGALRLTFGLANTAADTDVLLSAIPPLVAAARTAPVAACAARPTFTRHCVARCNPLNRWRWPPPRAPGATPPARLAPA